MTIVTSQANGTRMSLEQWAVLPEDEPGELVDGVLTQGEMPGPVHESIVTWLAAEIRVWGRGRGVLVLGSNAKYGVSATRGRMPDLGPRSTRFPSADVGVGASLFDLGSCAGLI